MRSQKRGRQRFQLCVAGLAMSTLTGVLMIGLIKGMGESGNHALAATATLGAAVSALSPVQRTCVNRFEGGVDLFPRLGPVKQAAALRRIEPCVQAIEHPSSFVAQGPPPYTTPAPWPSGIIQSGQAPFPAAEYTFLNQWQAVRGGVHVQVYAGSSPGDPSQGLVVLRITSLDLHTSRAAGPYLTSVKAGPVRITAAKGARLTLTSTSGAIFIFDVGSRTYVSP